MDSTYFLPTADMISHDLNFAVKQYFDLPAQAIDVIQVAGQSGADDLSLPRLDLALYNKGSDDVRCGPHPARCPWLAPRLTLRCPCLR